VFCSQPITHVIARRFSCRSYSDVAIEDKTRRRLEDFLAALPASPFGATTRFALIAATEHDRSALRGLGTYGFIKGAAAFIVGAVRPAAMNLEDFGYLMECAILLATDLGLGTCWLGGSFNKSNFAKKISAREDELVPAVASVGYIADKRRWLDGFIRRSVGADNRLPWERLFFAKEFGVPLSREAAGVFAIPLEMVQLGPSASNGQPWRLVRDGDTWHFYLQRTKGYSNRSLLLHLADLQRVDLGIAICHFELTTKEMGLEGEWEVNEPGIAKPDTLTEYIASWRVRI